MGVRREVHTLLYIVESGIRPDHCHSMARRALEISELLGETRSAMPCLSKYMKTRGHRRRSVLLASLLQEYADRGFDNSSTAPVLTLSACQEFSLAPAPFFMSSFGRSPIAPRRFWPNDPIFRSTSFRLSTWMSASGLPHIRPPLSLVSSLQLVLTIARLLALPCLSHLDYQRTNGCMHQAAQSSCCQLQAVARSRASRGYRLCAMQHADTGG